jgi:hypothetical protein
MEDFDGGSLRIEEFGLIYGWIRLPHPTSDPALSRSCRMNGMLVLNWLQRARFFIDRNPFTPGAKRFQSEWARFQSRNSQGIQGCWTGKWLSAKRRKEWPVKCIFTRIAPGTYLANFSKERFDLISFSYELQVRVVEQRESFEIEGAADLGKWSGGVHHFQGMGTPRSISCAFHSRDDHGEMRLKRVG